MPVSVLYLPGGDWGYDEIFCKSAKQFAKISLDSPYYAGSINSTIPCALIVDGTPIHHNDAKSTNALVGSSNKFTLNVELVRVISKTFPSYTQAGNAQISNPLETLD